MLMHGAQAHAETGGNIAAQVYAVGSQKLIGYAAAGVGYQYVSARVEGHRARYRCHAVGPQGVGRAVVQPERQRGVGTEAYHLYAYCPQGLA